MHNQKRYRYFIYMRIFFKISTNLSRNKRETEVIWTEEKAIEFCNNYIKKSQTYKACSKVPSVSADSLIANCILDVMVGLHLYIIYLVGSAIIMNSTFKFVST